MGLVDLSFWAGRKVFITGQTGFKGSWLVILLNLLGAEVTGFSRHPGRDPSLFSAARLAEMCQEFRGDVRDQHSLYRALTAAQPQIVIHLAAQSIVARGIADPVATLSHNVMGTVGMLEALRLYGRAEAVIVVTTDKVYKGQDARIRYLETDELGRTDPYGASRVCSEIITACYRETYLRAIGTRVASARAGNVVGGGDWGESRLVPDIIRAWSAGKPVIIRNPFHARPWQYVLDALSGYLVLAEKLSQGEAPEGAYNFGPSSDKAVDTAYVASKAKDAFPDGEVIIGQAKAASYDYARLEIDSSKVQDVLGFSNILDVDEALDETFRWYRRISQGEDPQRVCRAMAEEYWNRRGE